MRNVNVYTKKNSLLAVLLLCCVTMVSCKKFLEADPPTDVVPADRLFANDANALSAVSGVYQDMMGTSSARIANGTLSVYSGLLADEIYSFNSADQEFFTNQITFQSYSAAEYLWQYGYASLYRVNAILKGLQAPNGVSAAMNTQLLGESYFLRAFIYFQLTNLYGKIPLTEATDYQANSSLPRAEVAVVYDTIIANLKLAEGLLQAAYPTSGKVRPNRFTASALLARAYLYRGKYAEAAAKAGEVIAGPYTLVTDLNKVFLKESGEAIWELMPVLNRGVNTFTGSMFIPDTSSSSAPKYALDSVLSAAFEVTDKRLASWVGIKKYNGKTYQYPAKYKVRVGSSTVPENATEYEIVFRLGEQYLIRAEANAQLGNMTPAIADADSIRSRAGLSLLSPVITKDALLKAIAQERRIELFAEWGHRWFDLIRTNKADEVLRVLKPTWKSTAILWPIPQYELNTNTAIQQNAGYTN
ncbi:MAG: RagB/SusD family nutrient uptake outer membrane protein [Chitinophaga sp.]|uniref:RagB/SusD family nutrient uptake outer membrane protein n=1 Tax=Chitinophaga sp. TaxID=1869181 RepID=UPI001B02AD75|nr:RagB/SusD family nutrient uptake outer membrane protein [Chitinophaga sp.]MBO9727485.1 RagB/SusD family nutrient uptake outer membrane protein [Chitinophaga sp.]